MQDMNKSASTNPVRRYGSPPPRAISVMIGITNPDHKRICDISSDAKVIEIRKRDCVTKIWACSDGTLTIAHERASPEV